MTDFALQTETERKLYVEALFMCISRGAISAQRACSDMLELALQSHEGGISSPVGQKLARRIEGIMAAYQSGAIEGAVAAANFEAILVYQATSALQVSHLKMEVSSLSPPR